MSGTGQGPVPVAGSGIARNAPPRVQFWEVPFVYEMDFANLVHATNANGNIQIQADSDFKWSKGAVFGDLAGAAQTDSSQVVPQVTVQIIDSGTGRNIFQNPIQVTSFFGLKSGLPFILPVPYIFKARSNLAFAVSNYSAAQDYTNLRLSLIGSKIFYGSGGGQ